MQELVNTVNKINELTANLTKELEANLNGNKAAGSRARKITVELTKLYKDYRKQSIEESKK